MHAWEADVHYGLTYWLARKAGFNRASAETIASNAQAPDDGNYRSAISAMLWIIATGDKGASRRIQQEHFLSQSDVPDTPTARRVKNYIAAPEPHYKIAALVKNTDLKDDSWLRNLGEELHSLQDSWSHQGVPDIPFGPDFLRVRPNLSWGHPRDRGGWSSHDADRTFLHVQEIVEMACETWKLFEQDTERQANLV